MDNRACVLGIFCGVLTPGIGGTKLRLHDLTTGSDRSPQVCGATHYRSNEIWSSQCLRIDSLLPLIESARGDLIVP